MEIEYGLRGAGKTFRLLGEEFGRPVDAVGIFGEQMAGGVMR